MSSAHEPRLIRIDVRDNVAVVVTPGGLPAGARLASGLELREAVPEAHKVALADLAKGDAVVRYGATIGYANRAIARGSWVHEGLMTAPEAPPLADCPLGTAPPETLRRSRDTRSRAIAIPTGPWERKTFSASALRCNA